MRAVAILALLISGCLTVEPADDTPQEGDGPGEVGCWFDQGSTPCEPGLMVEPVQDAPPEGWFCRGQFGMQFIGDGSVIIEIWSDMQGAFGFRYDVFAHEPPNFMRSLLEIGDERWTHDAMIAPGGSQRFVHVSDDATDPGRMRFMFWWIAETRHTPSDIEYGMHEIDEGLVLVGYHDGTGYARTQPIEFEWNGDEMVLFKDHTQLDAEDRNQTQVFYATVHDSDEASWPAWPDQMAGAATCAQKTAGHIVSF